MTKRAFTIIELLVVVSIIALLVGILLPAIGKARDQGKLTISQANLRNLGTAHEAFNHARDSVPMTLFYDGHVAGLGVREAEAADSRHRRQAGYGLWSPDTGMGEDGYFISYGYDFAATSFHILTTDGIRGRDISSR